MRHTLSEKLEQGRIDGPHGSNWGAFCIQGPCGEQLVIIAANAIDPLAEGWEHVSVSIRRRVPNWQEMTFVKDLFWGDHECVVQFHPPRSEYINNFSMCLHLWRWTKEPFPMPPSRLVGVRDAGVIASMDEARAALKRLAEAP